MIKLTGDVFVSSKHIRSIKIDKYYGDSESIEVFASAEITFINGNVKKYNDVFKGAIYQIIKEVK